MRKLLLLAAATALFAGETGIRPRPGASDYPAYATGAGATIAAAVVPPEQVKKLFAIDLNKLGYVVVEVAVYPERSVEVASRDFVLRMASDGTIARPAPPSTIAGRIDKKDAPAPKIPERVQVHGSETIGYGSGGYNGRRGGGVYTESTVGVGIGEPRPAPPPGRSGKSKDSLGVQVDLENQALPEGRFAQPVAGYLYFPAAPKRSGIEITWYAADGPVRLAPPPTK